MFLEKPSWNTLTRLVSASALVCAVTAGSACHAQTIFSTGYDSGTSTSLTAAGRILNQTTFGPTTSDIAHVEQVGISNYVAEQLNKPAYQMPGIIPVQDYTAGDCAGWNCFPEAWWFQDILFGDDQLRQRVAFALSKLFVVSMSEVDARYYPYYLNTLSNDAFGNWFDLMQDVTLSGAMGKYLNMVNSQAPTSSGHADENYAREFMQLFSIGTMALNQDGSLQYDSNGNTIPNYTPAIVQSFGRAFTGYTFANSDCSTPSDLQSYTWANPPGTNCPMVPLNQYHDTTAKTLLRGVTLPAGQDAATDVTAALSNVFHSPSLPPFVSQRLIQSLVTSNPSPGYISRVSAVFRDDGNGVRGNMAAVISAILLDPEARAADNVGNATSNSGLMRDPTLWLTSVFRALGASQNFSSPWIGIYKARFDTWLTNLGESPHYEPSVFSFYSPTYTINAGALYAPEFQLENTYSLSWMILHAQDALDNNFSNWTANEFTLDLSTSSGLGAIASSGGASGLVDALSALLMHGTMTSDMRDAIVGAVDGLDPATMVRNAVFLVVTSPQYRIMV